MNQNNNNNEKQQQFDEITENNYNYLVSSLNIESIFNL